MAETEEWPGNQAMGQRKGSWRRQGGGKPASQASPPLVTTLAPAGFGSGKRAWRKIPQRLVFSGTESWEGSVGLEQRLPSVVGRARASLEKWEFPVLQTTAEQKASRLGLGRGGGAPRSRRQPSAGPGGKFRAPKPTGLSPIRRNASRGWGTMAQWGN